MWKLKKLIASGKPRHISSQVNFNVLDEKEVDCKFWNPKHIDLINNISNSAAPSFPWSVYLRVTSISCCWTKSLETLLTDNGVTHLQSWGPSDILLIIHLHDVYISSKHKRTPPWTPQGGGVKVLFENHIRHVLLRRGEGGVSKVQSLS